MLKLLHTSDWHLGKKLFKKERTEEHQQFLDWLLNLLREEAIDVLLIAGDIFDSPNPPNSALKMYYDFLAQVTKLNCKVYLISGNHDSAGLLQSTSAFLQEKDVYIDTHLKNDFSLHCHRIYNADKSISIALKTLPYFRGHEILEWASQDYDLSKLEHDDRVEAISNTLKKFLNYWPKDMLEVPQILMSHHLFGSFIEAGSEQSLSLSGLDSIPVSMLKNYDYVALGHIHKTQYISHTPTVIYPGSPIPMRFSESNNKCVSIIQVNKDQSAYQLSHQLIDIPIFKYLIQKKCALQQLDDVLKNLISEQSKQSHKECFLELIVQMDEPMPGTVDRIRNQLENSNIELLSFIPQYQTSEYEQLTSSDVHSYALEELFEKYYQQKYPEKEISSILKQDFLDLIQKIQDENEAIEQRSTQTNKDLNAH